MKLPKEVWLVVASVAFLISWLIDRLAGPVNIAVKAPVAFLKSSYMLNTYPFTATAIVIRTVGIFISTMLIFSMFKGKYFVKIVVLLFIGALAEFFAIQQLATGFRVTSIQWTLAIAYASLLFSLGIVWFILKGIWVGFGGHAENSDSSKKTVTEESVLEPPSEKE